jgi:hypothetical protein
VGEIKKTVYFAAGKNDLIVGATVFGYLKLSLL